MAPISIEELHLFHRIDREVFSCLIFKLHRDLTQSLLVMALWLWLENTGYPNVIAKVMGLPNYTLVNALANEAVACLKCLEADNPCIPTDGGLLLTKTLVQRDISLRIFNEKRFTAMAGIKSVLKNICTRIFTDILQIFLKSTNTKVSTSRTNSSNMPLVVPGFPHPLFGTFDVPPKTVNLDLSDKRIWDGKRPSDDVTDDDKTMFLTFSRGFPVSKEEVRQLFSSAYGDCEQSLTMGNVDVNDQSLFATMVLKTVATVDRILNGKRITKLQINEKHIWVRKYERRD